MGIEQTIVAYLTGNATANVTSHLLQNLKKWESDFTGTYLFTICVFTLFVVINTATINRRSSKCMEWFNSLSKVIVFFMSIIQLCLLAVLEHDSLPVSIACAVILSICFLIHLCIHLLLLCRTGSIKSLYLTTWGVCKFGSTAYAVHDLPATIACTKGNLCIYVNGDKVHADFSQLNQEIHFKTPFSTVVYETLAFITHGENQADTVVYAKGQVHKVRPRVKKLDIAAKPLLMMNKKLDF